MTLAATDPRTSGTVIDLIDRQLRARPDSPCVVDQDLRLSYQDFARLTSEFAEVLACYGLARGELVAVTGGPSATMVSLAVAIWRAGGAFLLFDPTQPPARQAELRADAGVRLSVTIADDRIDVAEDGTWTPIEHAEELACVVYTAGSTGRPNGVLIRHSALLPVLRMKDTQFGIVAGDRIALLAPLHVDGVVLEILAALTSGACLHIPTAEQRGPGPASADFLRTARISVLFAAPSRLRELDPARLPALRLVISAGQELPLDTARRWAGGRQLFNRYGVPEATIATTCARIEPDVTTVSIGRAIAGSTVHVLDESLRPVPCGAVGELCVSGSGVALGYLNRPELTARRFVEIDGIRMYRTGDYVREDADGLLYLLGRPDEEIQEALAALVAELLGLDECPGFGADLFPLGLTSVLVTALLRRVDQEFGVLLDPIDVCERPTIGELAQLVEKLGDLG